MGLFDSFPLSNAYAVNLDWIFKQIKDLETYIRNYTALNNVSYSGIWDITKQYPQWAVVSNGNTVWMSLKPVPAGVPLENTEYWIQLADLDPRIAGLISDVANLYKKTEENKTEITNLKSELETEKQHNKYTRKLTAPRKLAVYHDNDSGRAMFYVTDDGDFFGRVAGPFNGVVDARDASLLYVPRFKTLYMACTNYDVGVFKLYYTKDFVNWSVFIPPKGSIPNDTGVYWAPCLMYTGGNELRFFVSRGNSLDSEKSIYNGAIKISDDGTPSAGCGPYYIFGPNYIDPEIVTISDQKMLAVKNETTKRLEYWTIDSPFEKIKDPPTMAGIEAACATSFNGHDYLYADYYFSSEEPLHEIQNIVRYAVVGERYSPARKVVFSDCLNDAIQGRRHGSCIDFPLDFIDTFYDNYTFDKGATLENNTFGTRYVVLNTLNPGAGFTIIPNYVYILQGTGEITIPSPVNPYGLSEYPILVQTDSITVNIIESDGTYRFQLDGQAGKMIIMRQGQDTVFVPCGIVPTKV